MSSFLLALGIFIACSTIFAPVAYAGFIQYDITFSTLWGTAPTAAGSFLYDASATPGSRFSNFTVPWAAVSFDMTARANDPSDFYSPSGACVNDAFALLSGWACSPHSSGFPSWEASYDRGFEYFFFRDASRPSNETGEFLAFSTFLYLPVPGPLGPRSDGGGVFSISPAAASVPEPGTLMLTLAGGGFLLYRKLRSPATKRTRPTEQHHRPLP